MGNRALVVLTTILVTACSSMQDREADPSAASGTRTVNVRPEYVDENRRTILREDQPSEVAIMFNIIPGKVFGRPNREPTFTKRVQQGAEFTLELTAWERAIDSAATPPNDQTIKRGLTISPSSTRTARIGTFVRFPETDKAVGGGAFLDAGSREYLILIYVDRPCRITGSVLEGGDTYEHEITMNIKGIHWIKVVAQGAGKYKLLDAIPQGEILLAIVK